MSHANANELSAPGVSQALAQWRASQYANVRYRLDVELNADRMRGVVTIEFDRANANDDLIVDWRQTGSEALSGHIGGVRVGGNRFDGFRVENEHIVIPAQAIAGLKTVVEFDIDVPIAAAGTGLTRYHDTVDGADYVYSLFVPSDASTVFPCFDQPDLKATFDLRLSVPAGWSAYSNAAVTATESTADERTQVRFAISERISTYVFAFTAGPFEVVRRSESGVRLVARRSRVQRAAEDAEQILQLNDAALRYFADYFAYPYPFSKYDLILIPEFPYGGMEHAGATFLREDAILFPAPPTDNDRLRRALLLFHETAHQWFGDLVTMQWFDDLWLKEGFANFLAAKAAEAIIPQSAVWVAFHSRKSEAYRTDVTRGTTAIHQPLDNLSYAKSSYGNIVYNKAPAVLRQAEVYLGEATFREGVRAFTKQHAYGNADWRALVGALERASGRDLQMWAQRWVDGAGMPEIRAQWWHAHGQIAAFRIESTVANDTSQVWPQRLTIALAYDGGHRHYQDVVLDQPVIEVPQFVGHPAPHWVLLNAGDFGYGRFLLDEKSVAAALQRVTTLVDPLERALLWESIWESVREAQLSPRVFLRYALLALASETNATLHSTLLSRVQWSYRHYLSAAQQATIALEVESTLMTLLRRSGTAGERIALQRAYIAMARSDGAREVLKTWLKGDNLPDATPLSLRDRHRIVATLFLCGDNAAAENAFSILEAESGDDAAARYAYGTLAARANAQQKVKYVQSWLDDATVSEAWIEEALPALNAPEHSRLTEPLFERAIAALPRLAGNRKIFFVNRWLEAFVAGQESQESLTNLRALLVQTDLTEDNRRKLLEAEDTLARKVRILETFADER